MLSGTYNYQRKELLMLRLSILLVFIMATICVDANAQGSASAADAATIKQTALDYIEGWYEGNAERMEKSLHPELAKRIVRTNPHTKQRRLDPTSPTAL